MDSLCILPGKIVSFQVGKRTKKTLSRAVQTVQNSNPKQIILDKLKNYRYLIEANLHSTKFRESLTLSSE